MLDIKWIRQNAEALDDGMQRRGAAPVAADLIAIDEERRRHLVRLQELQAERNEASKEIGRAKASGDAAAVDAVMARVGQLKADIQDGEETERRIDARLADALAQIPNVPLDEVPAGTSEADNVEIRRVGEKPSFAFAPKQHFELGEALGLMDFDQAAKIAGSRFTVLRGALARLERALGQFMVDTHVHDHGYEEISPPLLVKSSAMSGTAQLPKFEEDLFEVRNEMTSLLDQLKGRDIAMEARSVENDWLDSFNTRFGAALQRQIEGQYDVSWVSSLFDELAAKFAGNKAAFDDDSAFFSQKISELSDFAKLGIERQWLIPTAEVSLTNLVRETILDVGDLPKRFTALTPSFRSEAGSSGRDTRGMLRQHQFYKAELVSITTPETSLAEHERMTAAAEEVLKRLGLHYRVVTLCTGDMGFASQKTHDIEVWLPGQDTFREISSCSVCGDFQARRMNARFRAAGEKQPRFVHTLNGSGTAVGRALIAVMENYQREDGSIAVPEALRPYMGGVDTIGR